MLPRAVSVVAVLLIAGIVLFAADRVLQPAPLSALTATAAGLAGLLLAPGRAHAAAVMGALAGLLIGLGAHGIVHGSANSPPPPEGLLLHFLTDAALGLATALMALVPSILIHKRG